VTPGSGFHCRGGEFAVKPVPGLVFNQRRDICPDPSCVQCVVFLRDYTGDQGPRRFGKAGRQPVNDLDNDFVPFRLIHQKILTPAGFGVNRPAAHEGVENDIGGHTVPRGRHGCENARTSPQKST
jgi:hypothetical protein